MSNFTRLLFVGWSLARQVAAYRRFRQGRDDTAPQRLVVCLLTLGPVFVKLGQVLSTRPDILPQAYVDALARLQADQPPVPFDAVIPVLEAAFGNQWRDRFDDLDPSPAAAASLAQVHRGTIGEAAVPVAVKIRRPAVADQVRRDLAALDLGVRWAARIIPRRVRRTNLRAFLDEFRRYTLQELDFGNEARTIDRFADNLREQTLVHLPRVHWDQTAATVLTMDWVDGLSLDEAVEQLDLATRKRLVSRLVEAMLEMFISDGLFHADLHPGNIRFHRDGSFTMLDFGMYGELTAAQRDRFILYWVAIVQRQPRRAFHHFTAQTARRPGADEAAFFDCFADLAKRWYSSRLSELSFTQVYLEMMRAGYRFGFVFPPELMLHAKALTTAEALLFRLDPDARFEEISRPVIARELTGRMGALDTIRQRLSQFLPELLLLGEVLPERAVDDDWDREATAEVLDEVAGSLIQRARDALEDGGLWKVLLELHVRAALAEAGLGVTADDVLEATWTEYYGIEPQVPVAATVGAVLTTHLAAATLALYRALQSRGVDDGAAQRLIYDTGWRLYRHWGEPPLLLASAFTRDPVKRLRIATDLFRQFPFGEPAYAWQEVADGPNVVAFDCLRCPVAEFFQRQGVPELCVKTWCNLDFPLAEEWGGRLERTGTLASGAKHCDFRWHADTVPSASPTHGKREETISQ